MDEATVALMITSLTVFAVFAGMFIWGVKSGQFRDIEEPKYRMFELGQDESKDKECEKSQEGGKKDA